MSKGEDKVEKLLRTHNVKFKREVSFAGLNGAKHEPLRFDFVVYIGNKIFCCIEVDGEQHFKYVPFFHKNKTKFWRQKEWDRKKNLFCLTHHVPLIRIPYYDLDSLTFYSIFNTP